MGNDFAYLWPFPCFHCRQAFKAPADTKAVAHGGDTLRPCPLCGRACIRLSSKFKSPRKNDLKQWEKVRFLVDHGFRFDSIHVGGKTAKYPETLAEAEQFVKEFGEHAVANLREGSTHLVTPD